MNINAINQSLASGDLDENATFPHLARLADAPFQFEHDFGLSKLPEEAGILIIRGARQYGKSTWLEQQIVVTIKEFGAGCAFYLNGDFISDAEALSNELEALVVSFSKNAPVKRIFIDEITSIPDWEIILKRLVDNGLLRDCLVVTTGSKATDLRRGQEKLPGRKGKLDKTSFLFTPISYQCFVDKCSDVLKEKTLISYMLSGGSPVACTELALHGRIPEYVIQLVRDWVDGEIAKSGRHRTALLNIMQVLYRFGSNPVGQAKLARESGLANNTVAHGYIELLNDLGCVIPSYPWDATKKILVLRKPCKYHFMNLLVALAYHPNQIRTVDDFLALSPAEQGTWYEWLVAQELQRRQALNTDEYLAPLAFWQSKEHEVDFVDRTLSREEYLEVKRGQCSAIEFSWFAKVHARHQLKVINTNDFETQFVQGLSLEAFMLEGGR